jgi:uncharacterized protein YjbI with pentapeptide repeats
MRLIVAVAAACLVLAGARSKGASWPAAAGVAVLLGLGAFLTFHGKQPTTPAELGRGLLVGPWSLTDLRGSDLQNADLADMRQADLSPAGPVDRLPLPASVERQLDGEFQRRSPSRFASSARALAHAGLQATNVTDLRTASLVWADLRGADLRWARLDGSSRRSLADPNVEEEVVCTVHPDRSTPSGSRPGERLLRAGARLDVAQVAPIFVAADLNGARLDGADVRGGDFRHADLTRAVLRGADLRRVDMRFADLSGADLRGAKVTRGRFHGARWNRRTRWPNGFSARAHRRGVARCRLARLDTSCRRRGRRRHRHRLSKHQLLLRPGRR